MTTRRDVMNRRKFMGVFRRAVHYMRQQLYDNGMMKYKPDCLPSWLTPSDLALVSARMRRYLGDRGVLPEESLVASVPVSLREKGDKSMGNQVSEMGVTWATNIEDPIERILAIHEDAMVAKSSDKAKRVNPLEAMAESLAPGVMRLVSRAAAGAAESMPIPANAVVSNVPMSPVSISPGVVIDPAATGTMADPAVKLNCWPAASVCSPGLPEPPGP